ncbi:MAG TPA: hypothetical protein VI703_06900 [Anaerolineales bacterium]|nr:hypothetical protein [Anaerolineales bacterium]
MARSAKSRRCYCLLHEEATVHDLHAPLFHCGVGGHAHLNFKELYGDDVDFLTASFLIQQRGAKYLGEDGMLERGEVEWLSFPRVLRLRYEPQTKKHQRVKLNDLSARVGPFLAQAVRTHPPGTWPHVLLATVQKRRDPPQEEPISSF